MIICICLLLTCAALAAWLGSAALAEAETAEEPGLCLGANKAIAGEDYDPRYAVTCHNGTFVGRPEGKVAVWRGVPFAKPPVGSLRFMAPVWPDADQGVYEAYNYAKKPYFGTSPSPEIHSEDCLYLNVFTGDDGCKGKPVMVWIHGGAFVCESASDPLYRGNAFAAAHPEVVLVTIEYRLGVMGFLRLDEIPGSQPGAVNNGIKDEIMALRWIRENIAGFGGDPDQVTIFGESAGGISTSLLCVIPEAKGLFRRAILQSGCAGAVLNADQRLAPARSIRDFYNAQTLEDFQRITMDDLVVKNFHVVDYAFGPMADGELIPADPYQAYLDGAAADVTILVGYTGHECRFFHRDTKWPGTEPGSEASFLPWMRFMYEGVKKEMNAEEIALADRFIRDTGKSEAYAIEELMTEMCFGISARRQADVASARGKVYLYCYDYPTYPMPVGAIHGSELPMIFHNDLPGNNSADPHYESVRKAVGEVWVSFAKTGVPSVAGKPADTYTAGARNTIVFGTDGTVGTTADRFTAKHDAIAPLLPHESEAMKCNFALPYHDLMRFGIGT